MNIHRDIHIFPKVVIELMTVDQKSRVVFFMKLRY
jgi:hypothetical protein